MQVGLHALGIGTGARREMVDAVANGEFGELVAQGRAGLSEVTLAAQERAMVRWHASQQEQPAGSPPPTLAVCGSEDVIIPPANNALLAERWPGCELVTMGGGGHAFMAQEPERTGRLSADFIQTKGI